MWTTKILRLGGISVFKRTLLTSQFKSTMEFKIEPPKIDRNMKKAFGDNETLLPFELESFLSSITSEDKRDELFEKLINLRNSKSTSLMPNTLNHAVVNYLVSVGLSDLLNIFSNKLRYGVFIDAFTGCYLINTFLERNELNGAVQIAAELMLQEDDDELVQALSLFSVFQYLNKGLLPESSVTTSEPKKNAEKPVKIRVKYLRNSIDNPLINTSLINSELIAKILAYFSAKSTNKIIRDNGILLACVLRRDLSNLKLQEHDISVLCKDVSDICLTLLKEDTKDIKNYFEKVSDQSALNYSDMLKGLVKDSVAKRENAFIQERKNNYQKWVADRNRQLNIVIENHSKNIRQADIEQTIANINTKQQQLWFFETQDKLDMEIFRKKVHYPKKWFGKKKKPRSVDDNYIPPEVRIK